MRPGDQARVPDGVPQKEETNNETTVIIKMHEKHPRWPVFQGVAGTLELSEPRTTVHTVQLKL